MRRNLRYFITVLTIAATLLTGCSINQVSQTEAGTVNNNTSKIVVEKEFTARDLDVGYEDSTATHITLSESNIKVSGDGATSKDGVLTISDEGTYVITGTLKDGQIIVDAEDKDKVQIVLNGAAITCLDNAPIYIKSADKTFITLKEKTVNTLKDGTQYTQTDDNNVDGVIFSKADLTINGDGTLNINSNYKHGIASKDDLVITGGTLNITAVEDALNAKDCVKIKAGTLKLSTANGNGIQSKNGDDTTKGYVYICGGDITISKCKEGIEGTVILIEAGKIDIKADDDGLNSASGKSDTEEVSTDKPSEQPVQPAQQAQPSQPVPPEGSKQPRQGGFGKGGGNPFEVDTNCYISITGGTITVDALGDGIDSNGDVYISGGNIYVSGSTSNGNAGLDYNGTAKITGGAIVVVGSTGMAQGFSDSSSQYSLLYNLTTTCESGTEVKLTDKAGKVVTSFTPNKQYQSVVISTPELAKDKTYTLTCGSQTAEMKLSSVVTSNGQQGMGGAGGRRGQPGKDGMKRPEDGKNMENMKTN